MSVNEDESDSIYDGSEQYECAHHRCVLVIRMIDEEKKRRKGFCDVRKDFGKAKVNNRKRVA